MRKVFIFLTVVTAFSAQADVDFVFLLRTRNNICAHFSGVSFGTNWGKYSDQSLDQACRKELEDVQGIRGLKKLIASWATKCRIDAQSAEQNVQSCNNHELNFSGYLDGVAQTAEAALTYGRPVYEKSGADDIDPAVHFGGRATR